MSENIGFQPESAAQKEVLADIADAMSSAGHAFYVVLGRFTGWAASAAAAPVKIDAVNLQAIGAWLASRTNKRVGPVDLHCRPLEALGIALFETGVAGNGMAKGSANFAKNHPGLTLTAPGATLALAACGMAEAQPAIVEPAAEDTTFAQEEAVDAASQKNPEWIPPTDEPVQATATAEAEASPTPTVEDVGGAEKLTAEQTEDAKELLKALYTRVYWDENPEETQLLFDVYGISIVVIGDQVFFSGDGIDAAVGQTDAVLRPIRTGDNRYEAFVASVSGAEAAAEASGLENSAVAEIAGMAGKIVAVDADGNPVMYVPYDQEIDVWGNWTPVPEAGMVSEDGTQVWDQVLFEWRAPQQGDVYTNAEGQQFSFDAGSGEWVDVGDVRWIQETGSLQVWDSELSGFQAVSVPEEMRAPVESMFGTENVTWSVDESGVKVHVANPGHVDNPAVYDQTLQLVVRGSEGLEYNPAVIFEPDYLGIGPALVELGEWVEYEGEYRYPNEPYMVQPNIETASNSTGSMSTFGVNNVILGGARVDKVVVAAEAGAGLTPTGRAELRFLAGPGWKSDLLVYSYGGFYMNGFKAYDTWTPPVGTAFGRVYFGGGVSGKISGQMQYMGYELRRGANVHNVKGRLAALGAGEQVKIGPGVGLESMYTSRY